MSWRNAPSVAAGLSEATRRWPSRSKASDGTIGDAAHAARESDHNPDANGVVHAFDLTNDPTNGVDCNALSAHLVTTQDTRVKYVIWTRQICNSRDWTWRPYNGTNPHTKHMHVSIQYTTAAENDTSDWWDLSTASTPTDPLTALVVAIGGMFGPDGLAIAKAIQIALMGSQVASVTTGVPASETKSPPQQTYAPGKNRPAPAGYRPAKSPVTKDVLSKAVEILHSKDPIGTQIPITIGGKDYIFAIEWHKHAQTDKVPANLKNWHRGVTVYEPK